MIIKHLEEFLIKNSIRDSEANHWIIISLHEDSFYDMLADLKTEIESTIKKAIENYDMDINN